MRKRWVIALLGVIVAAVLLVSRTGAPWWTEKGDREPSNPKRRQEEAARALGVPVETELDLGGGVTMKFVLIPAGEFMMGSPAGEEGRGDDEHPQFRMKITKAFYMGIYEVTQEQYEKVVGKSPSSFKGARKPVERVSWHDAGEFCSKLSAKAGVQVRLPTEAQWEYACRAGTTTAYSFGDEGKNLHRYGNYCDGSNTSGEWLQDKAHDDGHDKTAPVGSFRPSAWGLYDMHGNVCEWCQDWYDSDYYADSPAADPAGPRSGSGRVVRGGFWGSWASFCHSTTRRWSSPTQSINYYGFRVVFGPQ